jgi:hypothetical protein
LRRAYVGRLAPAAPGGGYGRRGGREQIGFSALPDSPPPFSRSAPPEARESRCELHSPKLAPIKPIRSSHGNPLTCVFTPSRENLLAERGADFRRAAKPLCGRPAGGAGRGGSRRLPWPYTGNTCPGRGPHLPRSRTFQPRQSSVNMQVPATSDHGASHPRLASTKPSQVEISHPRPSRRPQPRQLLHCQSSHYPCSSHQSPAKSKLGSPTLQLVEDAPQCQRIMVTTDDFPFL